MSDCGRDRECSTSSKTSSSYLHRNGRDSDLDSIQQTCLDRKRLHRSTMIKQNLEHPDRTVYVKSLSSEKFTDQQLIDLFSPYGNLSDIRVFKDYFLVQYQRAEEADRLIEQSLNSPTIRSRKLEIHRGREFVNLVDGNSTRDKMLTSRDDDVERKRSNPKHTTDHQSLRDRQSLNDCRSVHSPNLYTILSGPKSSKELIDCQILIVNIRQKNYAEKIESRLVGNGVHSSIRLLREDFTLTEAVDNAKTERSLYAIIVMPMHEERRTASFHILHGETEEHRNLALNDGLEIIVRNFSSYRKRFSFDETKPKENSTSEQTSADLSLPQRLSMNDRFPLSMLLCLLADGRQLTLDEIDRVLVYLLEKKSQMLNLPEGMLPPLPVQYVHHNQTKVETIIHDRLNTSKVDQLVKDPSLTPMVAEQMRQIYSSNETNQKSFQIDQTQLCQNETYANKSATINSAVHLNGYPNPLLMSPTISSAPCVLPSQTVNALIGSTYSTIQSTTNNAASLSQQTTDFLFPNVSSQNLYQYPLNSSQLDSIYQTYSQLNPLSILTSSTINQTLLNAQQQKAKQEN